MVLLRCPKEGCDYEWDYKGERISDDSYLTCPSCYSKIKLGNAKPSKQDSKNNNNNNNKNNNKNKRWWQR